MGFKFEYEVNGLKVNGREVTGWRRYVLGLGCVFISAAIVVGGLALLAVCALR